MNAMTQYAFKSAIPVNDGIFKLTKRHFFVAEKASWPHLDQNDNPSPDADERTNNEY